MIKVLFDHQKFTTQRYGGISRYFANIAHKLKSDSDFDYKIGCVYSENHYLNLEDHVLSSKLLNNLIGKKLNSTIYDLNQHYCRYLIKKGKFDILHPTYYDPYFIADNRRPLVVTVHDMTHERLPEYFWSEDTLTHDKRLSIESADKLIAISETTKSDLIQFSKVDPSKIEVIYHGIDLVNPIQYKKINNLPDRYLLFVGDRGGYKNFYLFIRSYAQLKNKYPDLKVVLTGGGKLAISDLEFLSVLNLKDDVIHIQASDEELNYLYNNALIFVYPSIHEGFGLPILEAFKAQCPILLSDTPCFREVAADAALYFETHNVQILSKKIEELIVDTELRKHLIDCGNKRLKDFPIERCIEQTLAIYKSLV